MPSADLKANRPLSPHLQIYRWKATMFASIMHRVTGGALYFGTLILALWLLAAATGPQAFGFANAVLGSWFGILVLLGYSWALIHHMLGGLRHFIWDFGAGMQKPARDYLAAGNFVVSLILTLGFWALIYWLR